MEFDLFSTLALALATWVLISPGWRLAGLERRLGSLEHPLLEGGEVGHCSGVNFWLPSWFALSVAVSLFWSWYFWGTSDLVNCTGSWLWVNLNEYIIASIVFTLVINTIWLVWLSIIDYKRTLFCVAAGILAFVIVSAIPFFWKAKRYYVIGVITVSFTVVSNFCRVMSSDELQISKFAFSIAAAGAIAGLLWVVRTIVIDLFTAEMEKCGFWNVLFRKNFFWKVSLILGSMFRVRDGVLLLLRKAGKPGNSQEDLTESAGSADDGQL